MKNCIKVYTISGINFIYKVASRLDYMVGLTWDNYTLDKLSSKNLIPYAVTIELLPLLLNAPNMMADKSFLSVQRPEMKANTPYIVFSVNVPTYQVWPNISLDVLPDISPI